MSVDKWKKLFEADESSLESAQSDEDALSEATDFADNVDLEKQANENQHGRREQIRNQIGWAAAAGVWVFAVLLLAVAVTFVWHLIMPECRHYLEPEGVRRLQESLSGIAIGGLLGFLARNRYF